MAVGTVLTAIKGNMIQYNITHELSRALTHSLAAFCSRIVIIKDRPNIDLVYIRSYFAALFKLDNLINQMPSFVAGDLTPVVTANQELLDSIPEQWKLDELFVAIHEFSLGLTDAMFPAPGSEVRIFTPSLPHGIQHPSSTLTPLFDVLRDVPYVLADYHTNEVYLPVLSHTVKWTVGLIVLYARLASAEALDMVPELPELTGNVYCSIPEDIEDFGSISLLMQKQYQLAKIFNSFGCGLPDFLDPKFYPENFVLPSPDEVNP